MGGRGEVRSSSGCLTLLLFVGVILALWRLGGALGMTLAGAVAILAGCRLYASVAHALRLRRLRLEDVDAMDGLDFEAYVAWLLEQQGFAAEVTQGSGDLGVDVIAVYRERAVAVQVKRSSRPISRRAVSDAVAGKEHYGCETALVVTNSYFTEGAVALADSTDCRLVDREELAQWMLRARRRRRRPEPAVLAEWLPS